MKLLHIIAIRHNPPEVREEYVTPEEYGDVFNALSRRFETVFQYQSINNSQRSTNVDQRK